ncbi:hypothetical protein N825_29840 [Skermanella stibiiresistens SB22]|uniref:DUF4400 domain-containing protein n=1 Tax=Skermanella stibiiresistens SB22 TaxID=1385369 RepID=W9GR00_9PROT|nr:hypothetical protein N825_29840 [Skermanella stibiiresistens SB22]
MLLFEFLVVWLLLPLSWITWWLDQERYLVWTGLGPDIGAWIDVFGRDLYQLLAVRTGLEAELTAFIQELTLRGQQSTGTARMASDFQAWWLHRLTVLLSIILIGAKRAGMIAAWAPFGVLALALAVGDGALVWRRRLWSFKYQSPLVHRAGRVIAGLGLLLLLALIWMPLPIHPYWTPTLFSLSLIGVYLMMRSAQKRL